MIITNLAGDFLCLEINLFIYTFQLILNIDLESKVFRIDTVLNALIKTEPKLTLLKTLHGFHINAFVLYDMIYQVQSNH